MTVAAGVFFIIGVCGFHTFWTANYRCQCMFSKVKEPLLSTEVFNVVVKPNFFGNYFRK
jgi:hypothetical protein